MFSKSIVIFSLGICVAASVLAFYFRITKNIDLSSELGIVIGFFGTELVILGIKAAFGRKENKSD